MKDNSSSIQMKMCEQQIKKPNKLQKKKRYDNIEPNKDTNLVISVEENKNKRKTILIKYSESKGIICINLSTKFYLKKRKRMQNTQ